MNFTIKSNALSGRKAHIWQRLSAIYLLFYTPFLAIIITQLSCSASLKELTSQLANVPFSTLFEFATFVAVLLVVVHAWVGVRDIIIDYAPREKVNRWLTWYHSVLILLLLNSAMIAFYFFGYA